METETPLPIALDREEVQLWRGQPRQGLVVRPADLFLIPFSLLWGGFAIFWEVSVLRMPAPGFFALWGIPFVLMGLYVIVGRFFVDAWRRQRTTYALTTTRVIIRTGTSLNSLDLRTLTNITVIERRDGTGTISFGPSNPLSSMLGGASWPGMPLALAFDMIADVQRVYGQIREAQRATTSRAG